MGLVSSGHSVGSDRAVQGIHNLLEGSLDRCVADEVAHVFFHKLERAMSKEKDKSQRGARKAIEEKKVDDIIEVFKNSHNVGIQSWSTLFRSALR